MEKLKLKVKAQVSSFMGDSLVNSLVSSFLPISSWNSILLYVSSIKTSQILRVIGG